MKKYLSILALLLIHSYVFTQTTDNQLWTNASLGLKLNKKFTLDLREEFRFDNNISSKKLNFTEIGLKYKLNKL